MPRYLSSSTPASRRISSWCPAVAGSGEDAPCPCPATPKIHAVDSGLAARLMRVTAAKLASLDATALTEFGNLLETFVVGELRMPGLDR